jgi:putative transposase
MQTVKGFPLAPYSCPLDETHLWKALRYTELNPVRARLVASAQCWPWSSAAAHCGLSDEPSLGMELWRTHWSANDWQQFLSTPATELELTAIRQHTHTGRPLGDLEFVRSLERETQRSLVSLHRGRPRKSLPDERQGAWSFDPR